MLDIGTGPDGCGITFGSLADGIVVAQRHPGMWSVSFRPNPDGTGMRYYTDPAVVARVVIAREHDETAAVEPPRPARAFVLAVRIPVVGFLPAVDPEMFGSPVRRGGSCDVGGGDAGGMTVQAAPCP